MQNEDQFNLVLLKIGYQRFYCPIDKAMPLMQAINNSGLLVFDTHYNSGKSTDYVRPLSDDYVTISVANPAKAFALIRAGEERDEK